MAVSKMKKCLIVTDSERSTQLLLSLQEFQKFEVIALSETDTTNRPVMIDDDTIIKVKQAQKILLRVQTKVQQFKRERLTFSELLNKREAIEQRDVTGRVLTLQSELELLKKQEQQLIKKLDELTLWHKLTVLPNAFQQLAMFIGTIPQTTDESGLKALSAVESCYVDVLFQTAQEKGIAVYCDKSDSAKLLSILENHHFTDYEYPYEQLPVDEMVTVKEQIVALKEKEKTIMKTLVQLSHSFNDLIYLEELLENDKQRQLAKSFIVTHHVVSGLSGWVEDDHLHALKQLLDVTLPVNSFALISEEGDDISEAPIQLRNHPLVEPFEILTEMYSLPKYTEVDPTPYLAPFYAVFFGMMVADIGYGLLLLLGTGFLLWQNNLTASARKNMKLFHILAYPTIAWGLLFASFFSYDLGFGLLSTSKDGVQILYLSVAFGIFQLICGLLINTREQLKNKQVASAVSDGLAWIGMLLGIVLMVVAPTINMPTLQATGEIVLYTSLVSVVIFTALGATNKLLGVGSGVYKLYGATSYIGDLASYTRLMALCVAGASIGSAFNQIIDMLPPVAKFTLGILLFVVLHGLNLGLALLGAYVHGIRLQFVEFFGKFYEGGGRKFKPLKSYEKYVDIKQRQLEEK